MCSNLFSSERLESIDLVSWLKLIQSSDDEMKLAIAFSIKNGYENTIVKKKEYCYIHESENEKIEIDRLGFNSEYIVLEFVSSNIQTIEEEQEVMTDMLVLWQKTRLFFIPYAGILGLKLTLQKEEKLIKDALSKALFLVADFQNINKSKEYCLAISISYTYNRFQYSKLFLFNSVDLLYDKLLASFDSLSKNSDAFIITILMSPHLEHLFAYNNLKKPI